MHVYFEPHEASESSGWGHKQQIEHWIALLDDVPRLSVSATLSSQEPRQCHTTTEKFALLL